MFSFEIGITQEAKKRKYTTIVKDESGTEVPKEVEFEDEIGLFPFAKYTSIFELFPDPANSNPRYVTRRSVVSHKSFIKAFDDLIKSPDNESPLKNITPLLPLNENNADKNDYNVARDQVHQDANIRFARTDSRMYDANGRYTYDMPTGFQNEEYKKGLIEYKYYTTDERILLFANNYPVYI